MTSTFIEIDGSQGEGGGQILRSSLALSMATGRSFRIRRIRAGRAKPGLMRQHLTCVLAAQQICDATVTGANVGSQEISFTPGAIKHGEYRFAIGTAGGVTLVLQAVLPALLRASGPSRVTVEGGTHCKGAPPFEFFQRTLAPVLTRAGCTITAHLERHGFYPAGGGRVVVDITPASRPLRIELTERGSRIATRAEALVSKLTPKIALRELEVVRERLTLEPEHTRVNEVQTCPGPGNCVLIELQYEQLTEVVGAVGEVGRSAELVARDAADQARAFMASQLPVGEHLADQLMVPMALLAGGRYISAAWTPHARTNVDVLAQFGVRVERNEQGIIEVLPLAV